MGAVHIPIAVEGENRLYSYWLSYQGSASYDGASSKGLSVLFSYFRVAPNTHYGAEYDSHRIYAIDNSEDSDAGVFKTSDAFVAVNTCFAIPSSPYMKDRDPTSMEEIANPVVCVTNIDEGNFIDITVSFVDNSNNDVVVSDVSKSILDCSSSTIVEKNYEFNSDGKSNLIYVINTGADADISLSVCTGTDSPLDAVTSGFIYDEYPLSFIQYDSNPAYSAFRSIEAMDCTSPLPTVSYQSDYDNTYVLIPASSTKSFVNVSCKQKSCMRNSYLSATGECESCPSNHLSSPGSTSISDCTKCPTGMYLSHPYALWCTEKRSFQKITSSAGWRIWASPSNLEEDWAWDVDELEFYSNLDCTGNKIPTNGTPVDSSNAVSGWGPDNAFGEWMWGGRPDSGGVFWIGMLFPSTTSVKCVRIKNSEWGKAAYRIQIQAFDANLNEWEDAWIARDLDISNSAWNTVSMDYPSADDNPTPTPNSPPTSSPPSKNPTNAPVFSPITPNPTSSATSNPTRNPTSRPTLNPTPSPISSPTKKKKKKKKKNKKKRKKKNKKKRSLS